MSKKSGYIWLVSLILFVFIIDTYYQIQESVTPVWQSEWFLLRIGALAVILIIVFLFYSMTLSRKKRTEFDEFKKKMIEIQENEWRIIAGELHDSIGQNLSAINIFLQQNIKSESINNEKLKQASDLVVETIDEIRRISQKLYPKQIERLGLTVSIQAMIQKLESASGIIFSSSIDDINNVLSRENEVQFFRIIQEILNNTLKHSKAKQVDININRSTMFIITEIVDDGIGFEVSDNSRLGFGLINIEERIYMIKGLYEFSSVPGKGTKFKFTVPIK
jgi:signal transduction histidine kinase